jgi:hypothetical protein
MAWQYCGGNPLRAAIIFGWGRRTVAVGRAERRPGILWLGAPSAFSGRKRWEDTQSEAAAAHARLAEAPGQQAPTVRTPLASPRLTAPAAREALRAPGDGEEPWPSPSTRAEGLHRRGFRRRKGVKAPPQKKIAETEALVAHIAKKTTQHRPRQTANACVSIGKPRWRSGTSPAAVSRGAIPGRVSTPGACKSKIFPVGSWRKTVGSCAAPLGVLSRPGIAALRRAKPGGQRWMSAHRWPWRGCR